VALAPHTSTSSPTIDTTRASRRQQRHAATPAHHGHEAHRSSVTWAPARGTIRPGTLAVRTLGTIGRPVVLLHGLPASGRFWGAEYDHLADHARLVVPDLLGFGHSPRPASGYGPDDHADALAATLHALGVHDEPAIVVGHSVGALVAVRLAARHPALVSSIVGFGPPIYRNYSDARRRLNHLGPLSRLFGLDTRWAELACHVLCQRHPASATRLASLLRPDLPPQLARDAVEHSWESFSETLTRVVLTAEATGWLAEVDVPTQFIAGRNDPVTDIGYLEELALHNPRLHVHVWPDAGHHLPIVSPARCRAEIEELLTVTHANAGATR
jgi:pimeloyl-ACP methyl ester carboxylesterase